MRGEWIEIKAGSPDADNGKWSPLMRGEWIEMSYIEDGVAAFEVSPHERGVD